EDRCTLVHNAIDERRYARRGPAQDAPLRRQRSVPPSRIVVGAVGRLSPEKGFNLLIHAAAALIAQGVDMELWIAGEGDARGDLQKLIDHLKVGDRVKLLGFCADTIALYESLDVFALSSL